MKIKSYLDLVTCKGTKEFIKKNQDSDPALAKDRNGNGPDVFGGANIIPAIEKNHKLGNTPEQAESQYEEIWALIDDDAQEISEEEKSFADRHYSPATNTPAMFKTAQMHGYRRKKTVEVGGERKQFMQHNEKPNHYLRISHKGWMHHDSETGKVHSAFQSGKLEKRLKKLGHTDVRDMRKEDLEAFDAPITENIEVLDERKHSGVEHSKSIPKEKGSDEYLVGKTKTKKKKRHKHKLKEDLEETVELQDMLDDFRLAVIHNETVEINGTIFIPDVMLKVLDIYENLDYDAQAAFIDLLCEDASKAVETLLAENN